MRCTLKTFIWRFFFIFCRKQIFFLCSHTLSRTRNNLTKMFLITPITFIWLRWGGCWKEWKKTNAAHFFKACVQSSMIWVCNVGESTLCSNVLVCFFTYRHILYHFGSITNPHSLNTNQNVPSYPDEKCHALIRETRQKA